MENSLNSKISKPFRVLAIDGGGMRGLYSAALLSFLSERFIGTDKSLKIDIGKCFDLIAGTSTGGLLACGLAFGLTPDVIMNLYTEAGREIFHDPMPASKDKFRFLNWVRRYKKRPSANALAFREKLISIFNDESLGSVYQKRKIALCVPATTAIHKKSWVFKTPHLEGLTRDATYKLVDVCMATSAAPIYFPLAIIANNGAHSSYEAFSDGGLWANSPVLVGLIEAMKLKRDRPIQIISLGTCAPPSGQVIPKGAEYRGILDWKVGVEALELSMEAQSAGHCYMAQQLLPFLDKQKESAMIRLPSTPPSGEQALCIGLDKADIKACDVLIQLARNDADNIHSRANRPCDELHIMKEIFQSS